MKNKHIFWIVGLLTLVGCKELTCDFTYSPTTPAAGSSVSFTNTSTGADDYYWSFGDNGTSTTSSPTHIYRKPGTYTVTLQIVRNKVEKRTRTQHITVIDTIPTIAADTSLVYTFTPIKFYAQVYNPWGKTLVYQWAVPDDAVVLAGATLDSAAIVCYFTQPGKADEVKLQFTQGDKPTQNLTYSFVNLHNEGRSVLYATTAADTIEQYTYIVNKKYVYQTPEKTSSEENRLLLCDEQDTIYHYGEHTYTPAKVSELVQVAIKGFQVDRLMNKIYAYGNSGLWVSSMTGLNKRQLVVGQIQAIKVDGDNNCIYWANDKGLFVHRLLKTQDNQETFTPDLVSDSYKTICKISVNSNLH